MRRAAAFALAIAGVGSAVYLLPSAGVAPGIGPEPVSIAPQPLQQPLQKSGGIAPAPKTAVTAPQVAPGAPAATPSASSTPRVFSPT